MKDLFKTMQKKQKKKKRSKVAEKNIQILESGKVKFNKDQKVSLKPFIKDSVDSVVCSRIEGIFTQEDVVLDEGLKTDININLSSMKRTLELNSLSTDEVFTVVNIYNKKEISDIFDFLSDTIIGYLLRTSTLASIYNEVKEQWLDLNHDDTTGFTNVLFIPDIYVFLDDTSGKPRKKPFKVNLLLLAEPTKKKLTLAESGEDVDVVKKYIEDVFEVAIKVGAKKLIVSPFCHEYLADEERYASELWHGCSEKQRNNDNIKSIDFAVIDDDAYIIFKTSKKK